MMKLWLTTCPDDFAGEYDDIEKMFQNGLTRLILQKRGRGGQPNASADDYERWLLSLPMEFRERIWVRGTPDLADQLDVRGCVCDARSLMGEVPESWKRISCVAHCNTPEELKDLPAWVSGALIGPVYQPFSALEVVESLGDSDEKLQSLASFLAENTKIPVILWGGIDPDVLPQLGVMKASGVSCLGGIWNYADSLNAFIKMQRALGLNRPSFSA